jgi:hypothetical protein
LWYKLRHFQANEFHGKEMKQLMESHDKLVEQLEDVKQKV